MALCTFFAVKNTPLAYFRSVSHSLLNTLHRVVGYTAVFLVILHAILYTVHFARKDNWAELWKHENLLGIGAGLLMLVLLTGIYRHQGYELFLVSHISGFVGTVILTALHRPDWVKKLPLVMSVIALMWTFDRVIRAARFLKGLVNNNATLYPLPGGATRVVLRKPPSKRGMLTGSHYYLWFPGISLLQAHPFTATCHGHRGIEFVIKAEGGITQALYELAKRQPGLPVLASADGPYGQPTLEEHHDQVILIAGGSGAAFTFGYLDYLLQLPKAGHSGPIHFLLAIKRFGRFTLVSWLEQNF